MNYRPFIDRFRKLWSILAIVGFPVGWSPTADRTELFVLPEILHNPVIFPEKGQVQNAEITLPIHPKPTWIFDDIWADFMEESQ